MDLLIIFSVLFSFFMLFKNIKNQVFLLFNVVILGLSLYVAAHYFINTGEKNISVILYNHITPIYLIIGPCYYFFILIRLKLIDKIKSIHLLHLIPALVQLISIFPYFFISWDQKINIVNDIYSNPAIQEVLKVNWFFSAKFNHSFRIIHFFVYCIMSLQLIKNQLNKVGFTEKRKYKSLIKITLIFLLITIFYSIYIIVILISKSYTNYLIKIIITIDFILFVALILELFKYPELLFSTRKLKSSYIKESPFIKREEKKITIPINTYRDIQNKVSKMQKERSFLIKPSTNFDEFVNNINQSKFHIRSYLKFNNTSFIDLKNKARVEEAIKFLEANKDYKLDYIAKLSGFNTRSNFFKIFKKIMSCTPNQFEKKNKEF